MSALAGSIALAGCAASRTAVRAPWPQAATAPVISRVGVEPKTLDLGSGGAVRIRYTLDRAADVWVDVVTEEGVVARRLSAGRQSAGSHEVVWDGRTAHIVPVPDGVYRYAIHARTHEGPETVHNPSSSTGGEELTPREFTFDRAGGVFRWVMPKAGRVRLRIGIQGFPHLRTLLDWEPLEAGPQQLAWDGMDASRLIRAQDHPNLLIKLSAFALADNTIIVVKGSAGAVAQTEELASYAPEARSDAVYLHARHARQHCHDVPVLIEFPAETARDVQGRPVLSGVVPVRIRLMPADEAAFLNQKFEVMLYEDLAFLFEEEDGVAPFTFLWDTSRLTPGAHLLTVNLLSYSDHYGLGAQPVVIQRKE